MAAPAAIEGAAITALRSVMVRVRQAAERAARRPESVKIVAVSKTKPVSLIRSVYDAGHRCFGENYVQEILDKAPQLPEDIEWHFIGHLQSNKAKTLLAGVPNLGMVQGVDNEKVANILDRAVSSLGRNPLRVFVQVNTSGEESKSGIDPSSCVALAQHVKQHCPNLVFSGLMTIGMPNYTSTPQNFRMVFCFQKNLNPDEIWEATFKLCPQESILLEVCKVLGMAEDQCELSMGMSGDFEQAIEMGSTYVRVGSTIFGPREYPKKQSN